MKALAEYVSNRDEARRYASRFKNEDEEFSARQRLLAETAREKIDKAGMAFDATLRDAINGLKRELSNHLGGASVSPDFQRELQLIRDFHLQPTMTELEHLVALSGGNAFSLGALSVVLKENKSYFKLHYPSTAILEKDLEKLISLLGTVYIPLQCSVEGLEVYGGQPQVFRRQDGQTYQDGRRYDGTSLHIARVMFENVLKAAAEDMPNRWAEAATYPAIEVATAKAGDDEADGTETGDSGTDNADPAIRIENASQTEIGRKLGAERARGEQKLNQVMDTYSH